MTVQRSVRFTYRNVSNVWDSTKSRNLRKQPYCALHTAAGSTDVENI